MAVNHHSCPVFFPIPCEAGGTAVAESRVSIVNQKNVRQGEFLTESAHFAPSPDPPLRRRAIIWAATPETVSKLDTGFHDSLRRSAGKSPRLQSRCRCRA